MKTHIAIVLLLCAALLLPAFAQHATPSSPASQPETATGKAPLPVQSKPDNFWDGDDPGLVWLVLHPYASKKYVRRNTQIIQDRLNELDQLTSANTKSIQDVDARAQQGLQLASTRTNLADQHTTEATNQAQLAHQAATTTATHAAAVETVVSNLDQYSSASQTEIRFRPGQTVLSKQAKDALDTLAAQLKNERGYIVEVQGFSSGHGQTAILNSRKVADSVVRYLMLNHEIPSYRIYVIGMGNTPADKRAGTRVEISLLKNQVEQAAK